MEGHLVYFSPLTSSIKFWNDGEIHFSELKGERKLEFAGERACIGYNDGKELHMCPGSETKLKQCPACAARDISRMYTRLDYTGFESFYEEFRNQKFSVYIASFARLVKCGVTRTERVLDRMHEQGADYYSEIARTEDAESAYSIEAAMQSAFSLRNGITVSQKMKLLNSEAGPDRITEILGSIRESGVLSEVEGEMAVKKLEYPVPKKFSESHSIAGKVYGNKGQLLFFEKDNEHFVINMNKKAGDTFS